MSRYGSAQNEGAAYFCVQHASTLGSPSPVGDYIYTRALRNPGAGGYPATMALIETVDTKYTEKWFRGDGDGYIYKIPGRRYLNDGGTMDGVDWTTFAYRGSVSEAERYRWYFPPNSRQSENRWSDLVTLCSILDVNRTPTATFDAQIEGILDVEQFLRVEAARVLQDDWDTIGIGNGQNAYVYFAPLEARFKLFPWDMDHTFGNVGAKLYPEGSEAQISRLVQRPKYRRMYLRILDELLKTPWDPNYIGPFLQQTQTVLGASGDGITNFIRTRRPNVAAQVPTTVAFKLTRIGTTTLPSTWPGVHYTAKATEKLTGSAPIQTETVIVLRDGEQLDLPVAWTTSTWIVDVSVPGGESSWEVLGFTETGGLVGSFTFRMVSTVGWRAPVVSSVDPAYGPLAGGTSVTVTGDQFRDGARVFFGSAEASNVTAASPVEIRVVSPAAAAGKVAVRVQNVDAQSGQLANGFEYVAPLSFIRGDANLDSQVDVSDPIKVLFYLYAGATLRCLDAADAD
ncbi:MAG: CotH kinase family protein, partial [Planctomycetes bacterium]|nr:CotH kinase family protein [Planctomycetota bacterium]